MRLDLSADSCAWDNTESGTLEVATRAAPRLVALPVIKRRAIRSAQRSPSGGVYLGYEVDLLVPKRELPPGESVKPADVIVTTEQPVEGTETRWTVLTVRRNRNGETFACGCVDLVLALGLRESVTIERATISYGAAGQAVKAFPPDGGKALYTVAASVQEVSREAAEERGVLWAKGRYDVTVDRQLPDVDPAEDRVRWQDGDTVRYLDILSYQRPRRIDELPLLECELR